MSCPFGTMEWYCALAKGHAGPHMSHSMGEPKGAPAAGSREAALAHADFWAARWKGQADRSVVLYEALRRAHACATLRDDGACDGCFVSDALTGAPASAEPGGAAPGSWSREESDRLASIRERLGKATKGEWSVIRGAREDRNGKKYGLEVATVVPQGQRPAWQSAGYVPIAEIRHPENPIRFTAHGDEASILAEREANADFIAHAPDDVAWLLQRCSPATASPAGAAPEGGRGEAIREALRELHASGDLLAQELCEDEPGMVKIIERFNTALDAAEVVLRALPLPSDPAPTGNV